MGTPLLPIAVIGSGMGAQSLSPADTGLELLENALATGAALVAIILGVGSISRAHLNPVVSCADALFGGLGRVNLVVYVVARVAGAAIGLMIADLMFALAAVTISTPSKWPKPGRRPRRCRTDQPISSPTIGMLVVGIRRMLGVPHLRWTDARNSTSCAWSTLSLNAILPSSGTLSRSISLRMICFARDCTRTESRSPTGCDAQEQPTAES